MTTGDRIRAARHQAGLTQEAVARLAEVSLPTIQRLEADRHDARMGTMTRIAGALGVPVGDLIEPAEVAS